MARVLFWVLLVAFTEFYAFVVLLVHERCPYQPYVRDLLEREGCD